MRLVKPEQQYEKHQILKITCVSSSITESSELSGSSEIQQQNPVFCITAVQLDEWFRNIRVV